MDKKILNAFLFAAVLSVLNIHLANAQNAPVGSCKVSSNFWCWPTVADSYGQPCVCPSSDGPKYGVIQ